MAKSKKSSKKSTSSSSSQSLNITKSYTSLAYGIITVIVLFILIVVGIRTFSQQEELEISEDAVTTETQSETYTVKEGQSLWDIAEEVYGSGFEWERIAQANNLENPDAVTQGMELTIPKDEETLAMDSEDSEASEETESQTEEGQMEEEQETVEPTATPAPTNTPTPEPTKAPEQSQDQEESTQQQDIKGNEYTVVQGDNLWTIAERAYGDGYKWVEIARANKLDNPDIIHAGNKLTLPR